jgi:hypothetical protein
MKIKLTEERYEQRRDVGNKKEFYLLPFVCSQAGVHP